MLRKDITYTDYDGEQKTEVCYFHLTKAEIMEFNLSYKGGMSALLEDMTKTKELSVLIECFKRLILLSYGEKTATGKFIKSEEISNAFKCTEAYSQLFMELATETDKAIEFINGIVSKDIRDEIDKMGTNVAALPVG